MTQHSEEFDEFEPVEAPTVVTTIGDNDPRDAALQKFLDDASQAIKDKLAEPIVTTPAGLDFETLFAMQHSLMVKLFPREINNGSPATSVDTWGMVNEREVQMKLHETFGYLVRELGEAMQHLGAKPWKQRWESVDVPEFHEELIDCLHFLVELMILGGMQASDVHRGYLAKHQINQDRQEQGY